MRRSDREVTDIDEILEIISRCDAIRIALNDDGFPYIVPLNFAFEYENGQLSFLFHSAPEGHKLELIRNDPRAAFEMDCGHILQYFGDKGMCTMAYESVMGRGIVKMLGDSEKAEVLDRIMLKYHPNGDTHYNPAVLSKTAVFRLDVTEFTAKRRKAK